MSDDQMDQLKRKLAAEPGNVQTQVALIQARARVEGSSAYVELLEDRLTWNHCPSALQDIAIIEVGKRLGTEYEWLETQVYGCAGIFHRIASFTHKNTGLIMHLLPGGHSVIGDRTGRHSASLPVHHDVSSCFLIGRSPVIQEDWDKVTEPNEARDFWSPVAPVDSVSIREIDAWLESAGGGLRLPSELEWEYACRAGSISKYFWGEEFDSTYCWCGGSEDNLDSPLRVTEHLSQSKWNAFGLIDMSGNIAEWCEDPWTQNYESDLTWAGDPINEESDRVTRGGGWLDQPFVCESAFRAYAVPTQQSSEVGFRVVRSIDLSKNPYADKGRVSKDSEC